MKRILLFAALLLFSACGAEQPVTPELDVTPSFTSDPNDDFHRFPHEEGVEGSHFRLGHLSWRKVGPLTAEFSYVVAFRRSFYGNVQVGNVLNLAFINFGAGQGGQNVPFTVTFVDVTNDWFEARATFTKTFTTPGPHHVQSTGCCRIGVTSIWRHVNNPDQSIRYWGTVDLSSSGSPASTLPPVVTCPIGGTCTFFVPATAPDGLAVRYRLANASEMGDGRSTQPGPPDAPNGASVDPLTGLYTWNTSGAAVDPGRTTFYSTQVVMEGLNASGQVVTRSMIDFLILLADIDLNAPPAFQPPTPLDGTAYTVAPGQTLSFLLAADDADADDVVTVGGLGLPAGSSLSGAPGNPASYSFTYTATPAQAGQSFAVSFIPTDNHGLQGAQRSFVIKVPDNQPPTAVITGPDGTLEGSSLTLDGSSSSDPDGDPLTYAWSVNGVAAGGNSATLNHFAPDGPATLDVELTVTDGRGGSSTASHTVTVENVAPSVDAGPPVTIASGETATFSGSFSDPGQDDAPWSFAWSFDAAPAQTNAQGPISGSHSELAAGTYPVSLSVTDKDGGTGTASTLLIVERLAVSCDVKPETINLKGDQQNAGKGKGGGAPSGMVILHCYSTATVDMTSLVASSGTLGDGAGSDTPVATRNNGSFYMSTDDLNDDGILDVVLHFNRGDMIANGDLVAGMPSLTFKGTLGDGRQIVATDAVRVIP